MSISASSLSTLFTQTDKDKTNTLSAAEVDSILESLPNPSGKTAAEIVKTMDSNGDGSLSLSEFTEGVQLNEKVANALLAAQDMTSGATMLSILSGSGETSNGGTDVFSSLMGGQGTGDSSSWSALLNQMLSRYSVVTDTSTTETDAAA